MSDDGLMERLRGEGRHAAAGSFGIDRQKARQKLQKFRLSDPHLYVLEFIQTASLLGASWVDIYIDADELEMHFDGDPLEPAELDEIYEAAFGRGTTRRAEALRHLAIGLITAEEVEPAELVVETAPNDAEGVALTIDADGEADVSEHPGPEAGTSCIYLRETFRASHLTEFFHKFKGRLVEQQIVEEHCRHSPLAIQLNGERVSRGVTLPDETVGAMAFDAEGTRGVIGFEPPQRPGAQELRQQGEVVLIQGGVQVETYSFGEDFGPVVPRAVVETDRLSKNLSQSAFVRDNEWRQLTDQRLPALLRRAIAGYLEEVSVRQVHARRLWFFSLAAALYAQVADGGLDPEATVLATVDRMPIWPTATGGGLDTWRSLEEIRGADGEIRWSSARFPDLELSDEGPILCRRYSVEQEEASAVVELPAAVLEPGEEVTEWLAATSQRRENRRRWERRPDYDPPMGLTHWEVSAEGESGLVSTVYASRRWHGEVEVAYVKQRRALGFADRGDLSLPNLRLVISGDIEPNAAFDGPDRGSTANRRAAYRLLDLVPKAMATMFREEGDGGERLRHEMRNFYLGLLAGKTLETLCELLRVDRYDYENWRLLEGGDQPEAALWDASGEEYGPDEDSGSFAELVATLGPLGEVPFLETVDGEGASLADLQRRLADGAPIPWLPRTLLTAREAYRDAFVQVVDASFSESNPASIWRDICRRAKHLPDGPILICSEEERDWLAGLVGERLTRGVSTVVRSAAVGRLEETGEPLPELEEARYPLRRRIDGAEGALEIAMLPPAATLDEPPGDGEEASDWSTRPLDELTSAGAETGAIDLQIGVFGRRVARRTHPIGVGRFRAIVEVDESRLDDSLTGLADEASLGEELELLEEAADQMLRQWAVDHLESDEAITEAERLSLWRAVFLTRHDSDREWLRDLRVFAQVGRPPTSHFKLRMTNVGDPKIGYVHGDHPLLESELPDDRRRRVPVVRVPGGERGVELLDRLFPHATLINATDTASRRDQMESARRDFYDQPTAEAALEAFPEVIPEGRELIRGDFDAEGMTGEMALYVGEEVDGRGIDYQLLYEGRPLVADRMSVKFGRFGAVCRHDGIEPTAEYDGVRDGELTVRVAVREGASDLVVAAAERAADAPIDRHRAERLVGLQALLTLRDTSSLAGYWQTALERLAELPLFVLQDGVAVSFEELDRRQMGAGEHFGAGGRLVATSGTGHWFDDPIPAVAGQPFGIERGRLAGLLKLLFPEADVEERAEQEADGSLATGERGRSTSGGLEAGFEEKVGELLRGAFADICPDGHPLVDRIPLDNVSLVDRADPSDPWIELLVEEGLAIGRDHPALDALRRAHADRRPDPVAEALFVSAVYTALSDQFGETTEVEDFVFHSAHARRFATRVR